MIRHLKGKPVRKKEPVPAGFFGFTCKIDIGVEVFKTIYAVPVAHGGVFIKVGAGSLGFFNTLSRRMSIDRLGGGLRRRGHVKTSRCEFKYCYHLFPRDMKPVHNFVDGGSRF